MTTAKAKIRAAATERIFKVHEAIPFKESAGDK